ncbi:30S ribosomal protein S5 [Blastopirellula sp. JC732]|uniref:Small ribosomal subunit protein uS5 n=1 Tax=Blastopirellula sediminis TaxID=2894196 RepID=A0A9X1SGY8_9BACT|nr:30S ribosomal protein S5 [Blastopirellula sediminis]MCC9607506.1 30S ribosomal protein S5 [Blastopirellula sediminis]MCC9629201.1 30S ribosomal protein S5 [Blastopirellula sediminis]
MAKENRQRGEKQNARQSAFVEKVVKIKRCAAVVKGGRRFSFAAMVVCGDGKGKVGCGYGKANEVPPSVEKAVKQAERSLSTVNVVNGSIPHKVVGRYGAGKVVLVPARPGTGIIAGASVRAVCEAVGIHDVLTKSFGSTNPVILVKATIEGLKQLRTRDDIQRLRGVAL